MKNIENTYSYKKQEDKQNQNYFLENNFSPSQISHQNKKENEVVIQAKKWIGAPFKPQGRDKINGCDCIGLILGIGHELNAVSANDMISPLGDFDNRFYDIHTDSKFIPSIFEKHFIITKYSPKLHPKEKIFDSMQPGDIVLLKLGWRNWHLGIISDVEGKLYQDKESNEFDQLNINFSKENFRFIQKNTRKSQNNLTMIHACLNSGRVIEEEISQAERKIFSLGRYAFIDEIDLLA